MKIQRRRSTTQERHCQFPHWALIFVLATLLIRSEFEKRTAAFEDKSRSLTQSPTCSCPLQEPTTFVSSTQVEKPGFHPVHVYHGPNSPLESLKTNFKDVQLHHFGSQVHQDVIVLAISKELDSKLGKGDNAPHFFVDLAANDAVDLSNTLRLEEDGGWNGLCIEPNPMYWFRLAHRKCMVAGTFVGGNTDGTLVDVTLGNGHMGGIIGLDNKADQDTHVEKRYTVSIRSVFQNFGVPNNVDYMSFDVEGAEALILKDFPFDAYKISILTVERPTLEVQGMLRSNGYHFVVMLVSFGETLWVHESVLETLSQERLVEIVKSNHQITVQKRGQVFSVEKGDYVPA